MEFEDTSFKQTYIHSVIGLINAIRNEPLDFYQMREVLTDLNSCDTVEDVITRAMMLAKSLNEELDEETQKLRNDLINIGKGLIVG